MPKYTASILVEFETGVEIISNSRDPREVDLLLKQQAFREIFRREPEEAESDLGFLDVFNLQREE